MFGRKKVRRNWLTATDAFAVEMLRAILRHMLGVEVHLTQVLMQAKKPRACAKEENLRPFANSVLEMRVEGFFTSLSFPRRHGSEGSNGITNGTFQVLPSFHADLVFTNDAGWWYNWDLWLAEVRVEDAEPPNRSAHFLAIFDQSAPSQLKQLSEELRHRGPARFREDE